MQSAWRGAVQRRRYARQRAALVRLQAAVRGRRARRAYLELRRGAVAVQSLRRRTLAGRELRRLRREAAAVRVQSAWRRAVCVGRYRRQGAVLRRLQATERARQQRARYVVWRRAAVKVQSAWRRVLACRGLIIRWNAFHSSGCFFFYALRRRRLLQCSFYDRSSIESC